MSDILQIIEQRKEELARQVAALEDPELKKKIADYQHWRVQLPILEKELHTLVGVSLVDVSPTSTRYTKKSQKGPKVGGRRLKDAEVESGVLNYFKTDCPNDGASVAEIARHLEKNSLLGASFTTIQKKVSDFLKAELGKPSPRFGNKGKLGASKWFLINNG
jgi:hypothetical protein